MGLDMWLKRKTFVSNNQNDITFSEKLAKYVDNVDKVNIEETVIYWRKANAIHNWFVINVQDGVDDCKPYYVTVKNLKALLEDINYTLQNKTTNILPTVGGFFFGSQDYNDNYWDTLQKTKKILESIVRKGLNTEQAGFMQGYYYESSW